MSYAENSYVISGGIENQYENRQYPVQQHAGIHPYAQYHPQTVSVQAPAYSGGLIENREKPGRLRRILHKAHSTRLGFRSQEYARY